MNSEDPQEQSGPEGEPEPVAPRRNGKRWVISFLVGVCLVAAGSVFVRSGASASAPPAPPRTLPTVAVERTTLTDSQTLTAQLGYGPAQTVQGVREGTITRLPSTGTVVDRGEQLLRVNDESVRLFYGSTPFYRDLDRVGLVGRDVKVLDDNLSALGYVTGRQPAVGSRVPQEPETPPARMPSTTDDTTKSPSSPEKSPERKVRTVEVRPGDAVLTASLKAALARWRHSVGMRSSGLRVGDVLVLEGPVRIDSVRGVRGGSAAGDLFSVSATTKLVTLSVDSSSVGGIHRHQRVPITLPDGSVVSGHVKRISTAVKSEADDAGDGSSTPKQSISITVDRPAKIRDLTAAPVQVEFRTAKKKGVLAVPVGALIALSGGGYALQPEHGPLVAVKTGMIATGMVEITGSGIQPGLRVVTVG